MGRRVDVSVLQVACMTWRMMSQYQVRLEDLVEVLQRGVELADEPEDEHDYFARKQVEAHDKRERDEASLQNYNLWLQEKEAEEERINRERDDKGRRIVRRPEPIRRSRDWREPTLIWLGEQPGKEAEVRRYAEAFGISRGAASMRMAELRREGKVTAAAHGRARLVEVQS